MYIICTSILGFTDLKTNGECPECLRCIKKKRVRLLFQPSKGDPCKEGWSMCAYRNPSRYIKMLLGTHGTVIVAVLSGHSTIPKLTNDSQNPGEFDNQLIRLLPMRCFNAFK